MEARDLLDNYNDYIVDIKKIEKDIAKLERAEISISGANFEVNGDIKSKGFTNSNIENKVIKNADRINELKKIRNEKQSLVNYIDSLIDILDSEEKDIIEMYYKKKYRIVKILKEKNRSRTNIYYIIEKAIGKMNKKIKNSQK